MKQRIFMYLFVFSVLLVIFQYVNSKRVFEDMDTKIVNYKAQLAIYKDSLQVMENNFAEAIHFNLERNEDAITYFENDGYNIEELILHIKDELYALNEVKGEHPVIPYVPSEGRKMLINTVKLLNHKWLIADFSDGEYWGEILLRYYINEDKSVDFELSESFIYPSYR